MILRFWCYGILIKLHRCIVQYATQSTGVSWRTCLTGAYLYTRLRKLLKLIMHQLRLLVTAFFISASASLTDTASSTSVIAPKQYVVMFKRYLLPRDRVAGMANQMAQKNRGKVRQVFRDRLQGMVIEMPETALSELRNHPLVEAVEVDRVVQLTLPKLQNMRVAATATGAAATGQETPWGIDRVGGSGDGTGKTAWVVDSGIDLRHPDLQVDTQRCFTVFRSGAEGRLGCSDGNGHGTHVAGTIAALDNGTGVVGVAAGATVVPIKVLDSNGRGALSGVIAGLEYVAARANPGDVVNVSFGGGTSNLLDNATRTVAATGASVVIAAGNESRNANNSSPARVNGDNIYTISAFREGDVFASFSNFANPPVDYSAPGVRIRSTWKGSSYATLSGTSMAAPHAAGVLLLGGPDSGTTVTGDRDNNPDRIISR
jgi:subtilisin family serine protease